MRHLRLRSLRQKSLVSLAVGALAGGAVLASASTDASAQEKVFGATRPGNVIAVGNTLGLSKQTALNGPGTADSIGTFISLVKPNGVTLDMASFDTAPMNVANPWFAGTTDRWQDNGSAATLTLPAPEVEVLHAELVWGGSFHYGVEDVTAFLDTPVALTFQNGDQISVVPSALTPNTIDVFAPGANVQATYYNRSADVTDFVKTHFSGTYAVSGVPATQTTSINSLNAAGWTLVVAYRYDNEPIRNMSLFVGNSDLFVDENTTVDYSVSGFCAPPGDVNGTIAISALEGDANRTGDQLLIAQNLASAFVNLSGPNNPANNFFASQINGANGQVDMSGTFGDRNQDAAGGTNVVGGRQSWDVTTVGISSADNQLFSNQTSAVLRTRTLGDSYLPTLAALAIEVNAPKFSYGNSPSSADKTVAHPGDTINFTAKLDNEGKASADHVRFTMNLPAGISLKSFTTDGNPGDVNGAAVTQADLAFATGVDMGTVGPNVTRTVNVALTVGQTTADPIALKPVWKYDYITCVNQGAIVEQFNGVTVNVGFQGNATTSSSSGGNGGAGGNSSGTGSASGGAGGNGSGPAFAQGGGFCATSPIGPFSPVTLAGFAAACVGLAARRRRRG